MRVRRLDAGAASPKGENRGEHDNGDEKNTGTDRNEPCDTATHTTVGNNVVARGCEVADTVSPTRSPRDRLTRIVQDDASAGGEKRQSADSNTDAQQQHANNS